LQLGQESIMQLIKLQQDALKTSKWTPKSCQKLF
jgi:hypothetical protein